MVKEKLCHPNKEFSLKLEEMGEQKINDKTAWIDILSRISQPTKERLLALLPNFQKYRDDEIEQILIDAKYYRYIQKQRNQIDHMKEMLKVAIPENFDYKNVHGLSNEVVEKLQKATPPTLFEASRISGIYPFFYRNTAYIH